MNKEMLGQDLKNIRKSLLKTQDEMSQETGLSKLKISNIENNKSVSLVDFLIYADALGYSVELKKKKPATIVIDTTCTEID